MPPRRSLAGKIAAIFIVSCAAMAAVAAAATWFDMTPWQVFILSLPPGLAAGLWLLNRLLRPVGVVLSSVSDGIRSFHDRDYSVRIAARRDDELGELVALYNRVGEILHEERKSIRQKELLLQTALDRSPAAIVLINPIDRVVYCNIEARRIFLGGGRLKGRRWSEVRDACPMEMRDVIAQGTDGLFSVEIDGDRETYHLARRDFTLNQQPHALLLLRRLTIELRRQEAAIWKKAIRIITHELNNSLAPISSLARSAQLLAADPSRAGKLDHIFDSIRQNADHLKTFLEDYARFARLPEPRFEAVDWNDFHESVKAIHPFRLEGGVPAESAWFDPVQMRQLMTNLLTNAAEASDGSADPIAVSVVPAPDGGTWIRVLDRGRGLNEDVMRRALLPFYTTKSKGAGLGLPLCREIMEAHGGGLRLQNREGGGTIVTCWLPPRADRPAREEGNVPARSGRPPADA